MKKFILPFLIIIFSSLLGLSQPANDDCTGAQNLGTLPTPAACPGTGQGAQINIAGTLVGATSSNPYIYQTSCTGAGGTVQSSPANDVWYSFVASGYQAVITVNSTFANPNISMYAGNCAALGGGVGGCAVGTGGTVTLTVEQMVIGTTYYIQVSGNGLQTGTFNMIVQNNQDCTDCLTNSTMTATPPPVNGAYDPGQTVNFCFHVSTWNTINTNWLHGVQLVFGSGWNLATLTTTSPATLQASGGLWSYYTGGCTSTATGTHFGAGFYFDGSTIDGNPGNNFGDLNPTATVGTGDWNFCFTITTNAACSPGSDLSVTVNTTGDGESGSWSNIGCVDDPNTMIHAVGSCCPPTMTSTATTCAGNDGTATATPVGAAGPYDYSWTNSGGTVVSTATGVAGANTASGLAAGTYTVAITNMYNCLITNTVVVANGGATPTIPTAGSNSPICSGSTLNLTAANVAGAAYTWSGPNGFTSAVQNPTLPGATAAASGTYTVTATVGGCSNTSSTVVTINANPVPVAGNNGPLCPGTTLNLTSTPAGATNYSWSGPNGFTSTLQNPSIAGVTAAATGTYTVTVTMGGGCSATATTTVTINANPTATAGSNSPICEGISLNLTSTPAGATNYNWSGPNGFTSTSQNPTIAGALPAATGTYTVTVTIGAGCTASATTSVTVNANPVPTAGNNSPVCAGSPLNLTSIPTGATNYNWSGPNGFTSTSQNPTIAGATPAATGTYTVTVTATGGCTATTTTTATVNPNPVPTAGSNSPICEGNSLNLTSTPAGAISYSWTGPNGFTSATQSPTIAGALPAATGTYTVTVTATGGCTATNTTTATVNANPTLQISETDENCGQSNGTATVTLTNICSQSLTYTWNTSPFQQSTSVATNLTGGTYTVTVSCGGCTATASTVVTNLAGPSVAIVSITNATCGYANGGAVAQASGGTTSTYNYSWSNFQSGAALINVIAGTYTVTVTDGVGCTAVNTVNISDTPGPTAAITGINFASCGTSDGSATLTVNGGAMPYTFQWNPGGQTSQNLTSVPTGNYTVTITDNNGCTASTQVFIDENPGPSASVLSANEICGQANGSATVNATGGLGVYTYLWSNGQTTSTATGLVSGTYMVTVSDGGCSTAQTVNVMETFGPDAGFSANPQVLTIMDGPVSFLDNSSGNIVNWQWTLGDGAIGSGTGFDHQYTNIGSYLVTLIVTDNNGCMDTVADTVKVKDIFTFYIPNVFTPNGDGVNDYFFPQGVSVDANNFDMYIFDRWGNLVFHTNKWLADINRSEGWNGSLNNSGTYNDAVMDVYVYRILAKEINGSKHEYIGRIALVP
jgi:gliding motility-associated-like protein